jgi:hypothetical protein
VIRHDPREAAYEQGCKDAIERIADELDRMSDSYIPMPVANWDVWEFCAVLSKMVRDGELTKPLPTEPPF